MRAHSPAESAVFFLPLLPLVFFRFSDLPPSRASLTRADTRQRESSPRHLGLSRFLDSFHTIVLFVFVLASYPPRLAFLSVERVKILDVCDLDSIQIFST